LCFAKVVDGVRVADARLGRTELEQDGGADILGGRLLECTAQVGDRGVGRTPDGSCASSLDQRLGDLRIALGRQRQQVDGQSVGGGTRPAHDHCGSGVQS
jgi:hypothetical protein